MRALGNRQKSGVEKVTRRLLTEGSVIFGQSAVRRQGGEWTNNWKTLVGPRAREGSRTADVERRERDTAGERCSERQEVGRESAVRGFLFPTIPRLPYEPRNTGWSPLSLRSSSLRSNSGALLASASARLGSSTALPLSRRNAVIIITPAGVFLSLLVDPSALLHSSEDPSFPDKLTSDPD